MKMPPMIVLSGALSLFAAAVAEAHPGHSHTDIPSVLRHPFSGPEHLVVSAAVGISLGALLFVLMRRVPMPAPVRWMGACAVAVGVTLGLTV